MSTVFSSSDFIYTCNINYFTLSLFIQSVLILHSALLQSLVACLPVIMSEKSTGPKRLPKRSTTAPKHLSRQTCLHYFKRIAVNSTHHYRFRSYRKYKAYARKHKEYDLVNMILLSPHIC
jgi:hypothetical protein